jgi:hypothetical protein
MPSRGWRGKVFVLSPRVQHVVVGQELNISHVQNHVQSKAQAHLVENRSRPLLLWRQSRDEALVTEACQGLDVVWVPSAVLVSILPKRMSAEWTYFEYTLGLSPVSR